MFQNVAMFLDLKPTNLLTFILCPYIMDKPQLTRIASCDGEEKVMSPQLHHSQLAM